MTRKKRRMQLFTAEEVKELAPHIDELLDGDSYHSLHHDNLAVYGSHALFAAWAASAAQCGDTSQLRMIVGWLQPLDWGDEFGSVAAQAAIRLAGNDPKLRAQVYPLARTLSYSILNPIVSWLDPGRPAERKLLERLCRHRFRYISKEARDRLASAETVPWWQSYFEHDPSVGLDDTETSALQPKFARYIELLDDDQKEHSQEILSLVRQMPPRAKVGACLQLLRQWSWHRHIGSVLGELLSVEDGARILCDFVENHDDEMLRYEVREGLERLPSTTTSEQRASLAHEALSRLANTTEKEMDDFDELPSTYAHMLALTWPGDHDPTPVLDVLLEHADSDVEGPSLAVGNWSSLIERLDPRWLPLLQERFEQALAADFTGRYSVLGPSVKDAAARFPETERRRMALEVLDRREAEHTASWAVQTLADIDLNEVLSRLDDPKVRQHAFSLDSIEIFVHGRRELREGTLKPREVSQVLGRIGSIFGGVVHLSHLIQRRLPHRTNADQKEHALQEAITAAAPELAGPVTDDEWALVRRIRTELTASEVEKAGLAFDLPEGPWAAEDLAWLEKLVEYACTEEQDLAYFAALMCSKHPSPEVLPLLEKLEATSASALTSFGSAELIADEVRQALGLPTKHGDGDEEKDALDPDGTDDDW